MASIWWFGWKIQANSGTGKCCVLHCSQTRNVFLHEWTLFKSWNLWIESVAASFVCIRNVLAFSQNKQNNIVNWWNLCLVQVYVCLKITPSCHAKSNYLSNFIAMFMEIKNHHFCSYRFPFHTPTINIDMVFIGKSSMKDSKPKSF